MARDKLQMSQSKMKKNYDGHTEQCEFSPGDQVLALMPIVGSPFQAEYTGPYTVIEKLSDFNYFIATPGRRKSKQLCHINLLKPFYNCGSESGQAEEGMRPALVASSVAVMHEDGVPEPDDSLLCGHLKNSESLCNLDKLLSHLSESRCCELADLVRKFPCLFGDVPSRTDWVEHDIEVGDAQPIKRFYRMSPEKLKHLDSEVAYMVENIMAVPSNSSWASPCILVQKDKTPRFCTDMRKVKFN